MSRKHLFLLSMVLALMLAITMVTMAITTQTQKMIVSKADVMLVAAPIAPLEHTVAVASIDDAVIFAFAQSKTGFSQIDVVAASPPGTVFNFFSSNTTDKAMKRFIMVAADLPPTYTGSAVAKLPQVDAVAMGTYTQTKQAHYMVVAQTLKLLKSEVAGAIFNDVMVKMALFSQVGCVVSMIST
ncbi:MAG: hypothetical protein PHE77_03985 [Candidatus Pacebacteria bacterium]|nr:hypothetical protein [Candidatus Paceibacterota bacterium]